MKNLILAVAFVFAPLSSESLSSQINIKGVAVVHYNATWNEKNNYTEVEKVKDAKVMTAWIDKDDTIKESEGIRSLPTVILYMNGKEVKRWEAGLSFSLDIPYQEIQQEVDNLTGADQF
tara:strand:- start:1459 stop:1815 length:357 start_codon:yes stop_codon:yes gene_type:complete